MSDRSCIVARDRDIAIAVKKEGVLDYTVDSVRAVCLFGDEGLSK